MACLTVYATAEEYIQMWSVDSSGCDGDLEATINLILEIAAADINAALASVGACDCTFSDWALNYLKKLNLIDAAIHHIQLCGRPKLTEDQKREYQAWIDRELDKIMTGKIELCSGETGAQFPSLDWADQSVTEFAAARIIVNDATREE